MRVLVIGDGCKDVFQYGKCERLSPEAPVPIFKPVFSASNGGMAVNVYNNLRALGVKCDIITDSGITKTRFVDEVSNQMLLRVDEHDRVERISEEDLRSIKLDNYGAVVISDYNKGFLTEEDIKSIGILHPLVFMDTKKKLGDWAFDVKFIKINSKEFIQNIGESFIPNYRNHLIVTEGKMGARWIHVDNHNSFSKLFQIESEHPIRDLSGAGDTFLSGLVADYIKNNDIATAIQYANKCASWVVTQKGVVIVEKDKI